ncbi:MAG: hypothetical protein Q9157_000168 [Trypethelium eluteriae]
MSLSKLAHLLLAHAGMIRIDDVYYSCGSPADTQRIGTAMVSDIIKLAGYTRNLMNNVQVNQHYQPRDYYRTMTAFDAFFDGQHPNAQERWKTVADNLTILENIPSDMPDVRISCDDTTLFKIDPTGKKYLLDPYRRTSTYLSNPPLMCAEGKTINGETK